MSELEPERLPPHDEQSEAGVLGCILLSNECFDDCQLRFKAGPKVFYCLPLRSIYEAMVELRAAGQMIDVITLQARLRDKGLLEEVGGITFLCSLPESVPSAANLDYYLDVVLKKHLLRQLISACQSAQEEAFNGGDADTLLGKVQNSLYGLDSKTDCDMDGKAVALVMVDDLERRFNLQGKYSGLATGWHQLDRLTDGLQLGEQTIIAARPSAGKTACSLNVLQRVCIVDHQPAIFVTLEMSPAALARRMLSAFASINMGSLRSGSFTEGDFGQFSSFKRILADAPLYIVDAVSGMNIHQVAAAIRRLCRRHAVKLVVVDYLQKISVSSKERNEKRTYEVGAVSGILKGLAKETGAAFLTLAQLNRESEKDKGRFPRLSDLADSGQIERDADTVGLLHRERGGDKDGEAKLIIAKQRDGEVGVVDLKFNGRYCRFENPL